MTSFRLALLLSGSLLVPTAIVACSSDDPAPAPSNQGGQTSGGQGGQTSGGQTSGGQGGQATSGQGGTSTAGQGGSTSGASGQGGSASGASGQGGSAAGSAGSSGEGGMSAAGNAGAGGQCGEAAGSGGFPSAPESCQAIGAADCFVSSDCCANARCETLGPIETAVFCCTKGPRGPGKVGDPCKDQYDCASGVCLDDVGRCSDVCEKPEDCPSGLKCSGIQLCIPDN